MKNWLLLLTLLLALNGYSQIYKDNKLITFISDVPYYRGDLKTMIQCNIKYPESALSDSLQGTVYTSLWIDTLGNTFNHNVIRGVREDLDNEALRVVKLIKFDKPAMQRDKPISIEYFIPVKFEIDIHKKIKFNVFANKDTIFLNDSLEIGLKFKNISNENILLNPNSETYITAKEEAFLCHGFDIIVLKKKGKKIINLAPNEEYISYHKIKIDKKDFIRNGENTLKFNYSYTTNKKHKKVVEGYLSGFLNIYILYPE